MLTEMEKKLTRNVRLIYQKLTGKALKAHHINKNQNSRRNTMKIFFILNQKTHKTVPN